MTMPNFQTIELTRDGRRLNVTFNRPDAMNAFDKVMHDELPAALDFARGDVGSDLIVLSGHGRAFSAGGDFDIFNTTWITPTPSTMKYRWRSGS